MTYHHINRIALMTDVLASYEASMKDQEIADTLTDIWLPVFRYKSTLLLALRNIGISNETSREKCERFIAVLEGMNDENK